MSIHHPKVDSSSQVFHIQFSLRTLLFLTAYASLVSGWMFWLPVSPRGLFGSGLFGVVSVVTIVGCLFVRRCAPDLLILGCILACVNVVCGYIEAPSTISTYPPSPQQFARNTVENIFDNTIGRTTLPMLVLIPTAYVIANRRNRTTSPATKWFLLAIVIAAIDVAICGIGFATAFTWFAAT